MKLTEDDVRLLDFNTYEEYLQSLVTTQDLRYLGHKGYGLRLYQTGYRALSKAAFLSRRNEIADYLYATQDPNVYYSRGLQTTDRFLQELAIRERPNRLGMLSTILYLRYSQKNSEISGYIDYEQALRRTNKNAPDWKGIFAGEALLLPCRIDLSYYNMRSDKVFNHNSKNYQVLCDSTRGMIFRNCYDRKDVYPNSGDGYFGTNTTRLQIPSDIYDQITFYDHVVRKNY